EANVSGAEQRAIDASQPLRDALYAMLVDAVLLVTDTGRRQTETLLGVAAKAVSDAYNTAQGVDWALVNADAREWASQYAGQLVRGINETTTTVLRKGLAEWIDN